jgi:hypothetical protein
MSRMLQKSGTCQGCNRLIKSGKFCRECVKLAAFIKRLKGDLHELQEANHRTGKTSAGGHQ